MNTSKSKTFVIALLLLAVIGLGVFAWREYDQLAEFRNSRISEKDLAAARTRAFEAEKRIKDLEAQLALAKANPPAPAAPANGRGRAGNGADPAGLAALFQGRGGADIQTMITGMMSTFNTPQNLALQATAAKANLSVQYAGFFRNTGLSGEQADAVTTLMANRQSVMQDVMSAAMTSGVQPDMQSLQSLVAEQQAQIDGQLKSTMGEAAYSQYETYQATLPRRQEVASYQQQLTLAGVPMDAAQAEALVTALGPSTNNAAAGGFGAAAFGGGNVFVGAGGAGGLAAVAGFGGRGGGGTTNISANNIAAASTVLTPTQLQVLQATQQSQQATASLGQTVQATFGGLQRGGQQPGGGGATNAPRNGGGRGN